MKFRTEIALCRSGFTVDHGRRGFLAGSCFSEHIFGRLAAAKFPVAANPTGILFNPASIAGMIRRLAEGRPYEVGELSCGGGLWFSYDHHGSFARASAKEALEAMNASLTAGAGALAAADYVVLTFGTAWVYRLADSGRIAANCHKQPSGCFRRERLSVAEIVREYGELLSGPLAGKQVLLTVSPVRHVKDGLEGNSLSKAILRTAAASLAEGFRDVYYFPSFEIMNDDLRDYRFYEEDMVHPSAQAVDYIWGKFTEFAMDPDTRALLPRLGKLDAALHHRVLHAGSAAVEVFRECYLKLVDELQEALPGVDFSAERAYFTAGL